MESTTTITARSVRFRVAIVGAGLGGLLVALCLQKTSQDIDVNIYESSTELTEVGAGVGMWPRVLEVIRFLGLEDELLEIAGVGDSSPLSVHLRKADEEEAIEFRRFSPSLHTFHRHELQKLLADHLRAPDQISYSRRLISYVDPAKEFEPIILQFKDGSTATCDLLIGSDGIRSAVRRTMFSDLATEADRLGDHEQASQLRAMVDPVWSGNVAYRGLIPVNQLADSACNDPHTSLILFGKDRNIVSYPISRGETVNVAAFVHTPGGEGTHYVGPWVASSSAQEVVKQFSGWNTGVLELLKSMERPLAWAVHTVRHLPTYVKGRVVLVGDAAHAMTPHQGSGAGQAIEDGFILATILAHPSVTLANLPEALKIHDKVRRPFSQEVQRRSQMNGHLYQLNRLGWENITAEQSTAGRFSSSERLGALGDEVEGLMLWAMNSSVMDDRETVLKMLEQL